MIEITAIGKYLDTLDIKYEICDCNMDSSNHIVVPIAMYDGGGSDVSATIEKVDGHWILIKVYDDENLGIRAETLIVSVLEDLDIVVTWFNAFSSACTIPKTHHTGKCRKMRFDK